MVNEDKAPIPWSSMTFAEAKAQVKAEIHKMVEESGFTFSEISKSKYYGERLDLRRRICNFSYLVLIRWMSEVEISEFLGFTRTGYMASRRAFVDQYKETTDV